MSRPSADYNRGWWPCLVNLALVECNPHAKARVPCVEVRIGERAVGYLTPAMTERYRTTVERATSGGGVASARAQVEKGTKGGESIWRVKITMSQVG